VELSFAVFSQRETLVANLKQEFEDTNISLLVEQERLRVELDEKLNSRFAKEKTDLENEITSKLNEQHSEEITSVTEQWKNKYAELKQKVFF